MATSRSTAANPQYSTSLLSHTVPTERHRLRLLEQASDPETIRILTELGLDPAWRCLELGAGTGSIARWLAQHCAHVVATDNDTTFLDDLRVPGLHVQRHDVITEDFPAGTFDLIHARFLLEHLRERDAVLAKAAGWLAPGGWLVIEDVAVFPIDASPHSAIRRMWAAGEQYLAATIGTDLRWAPRLPVLLAGAELVELGMSVTVHLSDGGPWSEVIRAGNAQLGPAIVADGLLSDADLTAAMALFDDPAYLDMSSATISAWGRRPPST